MITFAVRAIWYCKRSSPDNSFMSLRSVPPPGDGEDVSELGVSGTSVVTPVLDPSADSSSNTVVGIKCVWDFEKIERRGGPDPFSKSWFCGWCGLPLKGWNATKALNHATKAAGNNDVKACTGNIPKATLAAFQAYRYKKMGASAAKRQHQDAFSDTISENQHSLAIKFEQSRARATRGDPRSD
jgi:hypothetical protein